MMLSGAMMRPLGRIVTSFVFLMVTVIVKVEQLAMKKIMMMIEISFHYIVSYCTLYGDTHIVSLF